MIKRKFGAFSWILVFQVMGFVIGQMTKANIATWYQGLNKSALNPPGIVFFIVWVILYVILALVGWSLWLKRDQLRGKLTFVIYAIQMLMNWAWTPLFFSWHLIDLGFYWIMAMIIMTLVIIFISWKNNRFVSTMLMPYCLWLVFAGYLNWVIWMKN